MFKKLLSWLTGAPVEKIGDFFIDRQKQKHELKMAKHELKHAVEMARVEAQKAQAQHYANWELMQIRNSGWKDEFSGTPAL
jgi:hypothetical protein